MAINQSFADRYVAIAKAREARNESAADIASEFVDNWEELYANIMHTAPEDCSQEYVDGYLAALNHIRAFLLSQR